MEEYLIYASKEQACIFWKSAAERQSYVPA